MNLDLRFFNTDERLLGAVANCSLPIHYFLFPIIVLYRQPLWNKYFSFSIFEILEEEVGY